MQDFREIRLSALKKAPEMFGSVYEHEEKKPMEAFAERLRDAVAFGAYIDGVYLRGALSGRLVSRKAIAAVEDYLDLELARHA